MVYVTSVADVLYHLGSHFWSDCDHSHQKGEVDPMPRIFVALRQEKVDGVPKRLCTGGLAGMKTAMKEYPGSSWAVALYEFKPNVETLCILLKDIGSKKALKLVTESYEFEVNDKGRLKQL